MIWCFIGNQRYFVLLGLLYCSDFDYRFSIFIILFLGLWMTFLKMNSSLIHHYLFNFSLAATRRSTFSESLEICLNNPWYCFQSLISPFKFPVWSTRSLFFIPLMASKREGYTVKLFFQIISWNTNLTLIHSILYHQITIKLFLSFH